MPLFHFDNSYHRLPDDFFRRCDPTPVSAPRLLKFNDALAEELGADLSGCDAQTLAAIFSGNVIPEGAEPVAMAYAGHQFGGFAPQLGDGRALLLGEVIDRNGQRRDIQLKGAGRTPFSRGGDGRAPLGPVIREYLVSEAMHALGVPTTRALAAVLTGDTVMRDDVLPGAVLTRVAASHIRVGTFEYFAARGQHERVRQLADYVIHRHYPALHTEPQPYLALLQTVIARQVELIAQWMSLGFIHGVMNTDNMLVSGETIDYGPCAFMDEYHPESVFSSIDRHGRYAWRMQPAIVQWNMTRFAETLVPLLDDDEDKAVALATEQVRVIRPLSESARLARFRAKLGLHSDEPDDAALIDDLLLAMDQNDVDFTLLFRHLCDASLAPANAPAVRALFTRPQAWDDWAPRWGERLARESVTPAARREAMRATNPGLIPRNHRVEQVINEALSQQSLAGFERLLSLLMRPFDDHAEAEDWLGPPAQGEQVCKTFCGT